MTNTRIRNIDELRAHAELVASSCLEPVLYCVEYAFVTSIRVQSRLYKRAEEAVAFADALIRDGVQVYNMYAVSDIWHNPAQVH